jgi:hypothetical protein
VLLVTKTVIIDEKDSFGRYQLEEDYVPHKDALRSTSKLGAAALSSMRSTGRARFAGPVDQKVVVTDTTYAVVDKSTLNTPDGMSQRSTYTEADLAQKQRGDRSRLQVVAGHEVVINT